MHVANYTVEVAKNHKKATKLINRMVQKGWDLFSLHAGTDVILVVFRRTTPEPPNEPGRETKTRLKRASERRKADS